MNGDDSWEDAAQAALEIHRRVISAVRERVTTGTKKVCLMTHGTNPGKRNKRTAACVL